MVTLQSNIEKINASATEVYEFLSNFNNFKNLVPEQVENWQSDEDSCSFTLKGLATLGLKIIEKVPSHKIVIASDGQAPVDFTMIFNIKESETDNCSFHIDFLADMNNLMAMMVKTPLQNFVDALAKKLRLYYE